MSLGKTLQRYLFLLCCTTILLAGTSSIAFAQGLCGEQGLPVASGAWDPEVPFRRIAQLMLADCLGGSNDSTTVSVNVRKMLDVPRDESDRFRPAAEVALREISGHADMLHRTLAADVLRELTLQITLSRSLLGTGQAPALPTAWDLDQGRLLVVSIPLQQSVTRACQTASDGCRQQYDLVKEVVRLAVLTRTALDLSETPVMLKHLQETARRAQMWDEYFSAARSQYLWEQIVNGRLMADSREEVDRVKRGFRNVPSGQLLILHPTVAFEYADAEPEGNRFAGVAVVDILGYNRWRWKNDGTMGYALGGSVVLAVGDHVNTSDVGWGLMLHVDHRWSAGAIFDSDKTSVVVSTDVAQLWTKVSDSRKRRIMTGK